MKISVKEASRIMGVSPNLLRLMIREKKFPPHVAFSIKNKNKFYYFINKEGFINFLRDSK